MESLYTHKKILHFLRSVGIMSAAIDSSNGPISSILLFAVDDDFTFYFATHSNTRKAFALAFDPRIALSVWKQHEMLVQAEGTASIITEPREINSVFDKLCNSVESLQNFWPPVVHIEGNGYCLFKIKLNRMSVLPLKNISVHDYNDPFIPITLPV